MIPQRIESVFTERYESGESVLSAQVNSVKGVYTRKTAGGIRKIWAGFYRATAQGHKNRGQHKLCDRK